MASSSVDRQHDADDEPTATQKAWEAMAEAYRVALEQRLPYCPTSSALENYQLGLALNQAYWFQVNAQSYDQALGRNQRGGD